MSSAAIFVWRFKGYSGQEWTLLETGLGGKELL